MYHVFSFSAFFTPLTFTFNGAFASLWAIIAATLFLLYTRATAQMPPLSMCTDWVIEIVPGQPAGLPLNAPAEDPVCGPLYYSVYLVPDGARNGRDFVFNHFEISGALFGADISSGSRPVASAFNNQRSVDCSPASLYKEGSVFTAGGSHFSYVIAADEVESTTWEVNGSRLLFVLAVDAFLDEGITLGALQGRYSRPDSDMGSVWCEFLIKPGNLSGDLMQALTLPSACKSGLAVGIGAAQNAPTEQFPQRRVMPVFVHSITPKVDTVADIDLHLQLATTDNQLGGYVLTDGLVPGSLVQSFRATSSLVNLSLNGYALGEIKTGPVATAANTLFYIALNGPPLASTCAQATARLESGRLSQKGHPCCQLPFTSGPLSSRTVTWMPPPPASCLTGCDLYTLEAKKYPPHGAPCNELYFLVELSTTASPKIITDVHFTLDVAYNANGAVQWDTSISVLPLCPGPTSCVDVQYIAPGLLRLTYELHGTALQLTNDGSPYGLALMGFKSHDVCIQSLDFRDATLKSTSHAAACIPNVHSQILKDDPSTHLCLNNLSVTYALEDGRIPPDEMTLRVTPGCLSRKISGGSYSQCNTCPAIPYQLYLENNESWLAGVTTLDLLEITKHILNIKPLSSPYKMIAADANYSNTISTLDVVTLRKLILGVHDTLPSTLLESPRSFKFIDKNYVFPNPLNPFEGLPAAAHRMEAAQGVKADYIAIKIGDVNLGYTQRSGRQLLGYQIPSAEQGQEFEVPVFATDNALYTGWQMAFRYDTSVAVCKGIRWPAEKESLEDRGWHEPQKGQLRTLWYQAAGKAQSFSRGTPLFYVQFRARKPLNAAAQKAGAGRLLTFHPAIPAEAYTPNEKVMTLSVQPSDIAVAERQEKAKIPEVPPVLQMDLYPNPAKTVFRVELWATEPVEALLSVHDAMGNTLVQQRVALSQGLNTFFSTQWKDHWQPGHYSVRIETPKEQISKKLIIR